MNVRFGYGSPAELRELPEILRLVEQADLDGLDHFSTSDHPYLAERLDGYAMIGFLLGRTERIAGSDRNRLDCRRPGDEDLAAQRGEVG